MNTYYTAEKHTQILIALLKFHGIKKIIASPGTTNICLLASLQSDPFFEIYSSVDERSAAFIAVGLAAESNNPVALVCTGATASRNYTPGLTEAFYRKLPVLAITATQHTGRVGTGYSQVIDRSQPLNDIAVESVLVDCVYTKEDEWECEININKALIALRKNGGGPAHINLVTTYSKDFSVKELPPVKGIRQIEDLSDMPSLDGYKKIAILVGNHGKWSQALQDSVDTFCEQYNAVVLDYHASNYKGRHGVNFAIINSMCDYYIAELRDAPLVIYIGGIPRYLSGMKHDSCEMWRINRDGIIRDPEKMLTRVFAMDEQTFFDYYTAKKPADENSHESEYALAWQQEYDKIIQQTPALPFSNVWVAQNTITKLPDGCVLHMAGSNTSRAWNFFCLPKSVECYSNDGTMGIDGQVSALIGESLASPNRLHFGVVGDLTFFYDMNSIGNRHVGNNLRLIVINNGVGAEFKIYSHPAYRFGEDGNAYMAAAGHYGNKSPELLKHYAQDLGFEYLCASNKEEYLSNLNKFLDPMPADRPMLFEVFTDYKDESDAIYAMNHIVHNMSGSFTSAAKGAIKKILGEKGVETIKKLLNK